MEGVSIERVRVEYVDGLIDALEAVAAEDRWIGLEPGFDREKLRERFVRAVNDPYQAVFVVLADGVVVGSAGVYRNVEADYVLGMSLTPAYRGLGIGAQLLECAESWARERGIPELSLLVFKHNARAIKLYEGAGFIQAAIFERVTRQSGAVFEVILMTKDLRTA